jgi:hypothetical protein
MIHHKYLEHKEYVQFKLTDNSLSDSAFIPTFKANLENFPHSCGLNHRYVQAADVFYLV